MKVLRTVENSEGVLTELQSAIVPFCHPEMSAIRIDFVGALHLADRSSFAHLNAALSQYDFVFFEMVAPQYVIDRKLFNPVAGELSDSAEASFQIYLEFLGIAEQKLHLNYRSARFIHADLSYEEFFSGLKEFGGEEAVFEPGWQRQTDFIEFMYAHLAKRWPLRSPLVAALSTGEVYYEARQSLAAWLWQQKVHLAESQRTLIVERRENRLLEVMKRKLPALDLSRSWKIAVLYGIDHFPSLAESLRLELGFLQEGAYQWFSVLSLDPGIVPPPAHFARAKEVLGLQ